MPIIDDRYKYGFHEPENYVFKSQRGLTEQVVRNISRLKREPEWMRRYRLRALKFFGTKPLPSWGPDLTHIDFDNIFYYIKPTEKK
jgi:Fe-S cluster assembly protein SufB